MIRRAWQQLSERLRQRPTRERQLIVGAAVAGAVLLYLAAWLPLQAELGQLRATVPQKKTQLARMQAQAQEVAQWRASGRAPVAGGNLLVHLEQSATANGLRGRIARMEPEGNHAARVTLEAAPFNALVGWLADLNRQGGIQIEKATFEAAPSGPGLVNARLVLRGAGA